MLLAYDTFMCVIGVVRYINMAPWHVMVVCVLDIVYWRLVNLSIVQRERKHGYQSLFLHEVDL